MSKHLNNYAPSAPRDRGGFEEDRILVIPESGMMAEMKKVPNYHTLPQMDTHIVEEEGGEGQGTPFVILLCQAILSNVNLRSNLYLIGVLAFSLLGNYVGQYQDFFYLAQEGNFFDVYFVDYAWMWTLGFLLPFVIMTNVAHTGCRGFMAGCFRVAAATGVLVGILQLFKIIRNNHQFNPSNDCFVLVWSIFVKIEESSSYHGWDDTRDYLRLHPKKTSDHKLRLGRMNFFTVPVRLTLMSMALLTILWDVTIFSKVLFLNSWAENILPVALALFIWLLLYQGIYMLPTSRSPNYLLIK